MPDSYVAYCDESAQRDYGTATDQYFVIAAVAVLMTEATHLEDELRGLSGRSGARQTSRLSRTGYGILLSGKGTTQIRAGFR